MPDASIVVCLPDGVPLSDPDQAETERRGLRLASEPDTTSIGVVGWSSGGAAALALAAGHPELTRLALVAVPFETFTGADAVAPDSIAAGVEFGDIRAKTLLLFGSADPNTGSKHGRQWQQHLPNARLEMVPRGGHDLLAPMWHRILSHVAPGRPKRA